MSSDQLQGTLVEAGVVKGRTLTSWPSLQTDLRNAGAEWVDEGIHAGQRRRAGAAGGAAARRTCSSFERTAAGVTSAPTMSTPTCERR
jgi:putative intracellular protease/amidase